MSDLTLVPSTIQRNELPTVENLGILNKVVILFSGKIYSHKKQDYF